MENISYDYVTMFDEAQKQLERQYKSSTALRSHAITVMNISSVIVSFFATFKVFDNKDAFSSSPILLIILALVYSVLMLFAIWASSPIALASPIPPRVKDYLTAYADKTTEEVFASQINLYLEAVIVNEGAIKRQFKYCTTIDYLLGVVVILIVLITLVFGV